MPGAAYRWMILPGQGHGSPTGGITPTARVFLIPGTLSGTAKLGQFNPNSGFDDPVDGGFHFFRVEEIQAGRFPTIRKFVIIFRDLGVATLNVTFTAVDQQFNIVTQPFSYSIGTVGATGRLMTLVQDCLIAGYLPQMSIAKTAGQGPISIAKVVIAGEVEEVKL